MKYTDEQKEKLIEGLRRYDFTKVIHLGRTGIPSDEAVQEENPLKKLVLGYMGAVLPDFGITRNMSNFSNDHPINLLMDADAEYISDEAMKVLGDTEQTAAAIEKFLELFGPLFDIATNSYCAAKGKEPNDLNDEDMQRIIDRVLTVINEELVSAIMQGQQFSEINEIAHTSQTHEDFGNKRNWDSANFSNRWTHCKTKVGQMLELENDAMSVPKSEDDTFFQIVLDAFCETLDDADLTIFRMREDCCTHAEIAEKLGYKNHSAVTKRLKRLRSLWDKFMNEHEPK